MATSRLIDGHTRTSQSPLLPCPSATRQRSEFQKLGLPGTYGCANHLTPVIDVEACSSHVARQKRKVLYTFLLGPQEGLVNRAARRSRSANDDAFIINGDFSISHAQQSRILGTSETAEIVNRSVAFPKHRVRSRIARRDHCFIAAT